MKKGFAWLLVAALLLTGCGGQSAEPEETTGQTEPEKNAAVSQKPAAEIDTSNLFTDRDLSGDYTENKSARITLNGDSASCDSNAVKIEGSTVTIIDEGTYILSGKLTDGQIVVNAAKEDKTQLVLSGADITSATGAAVYVLQADKVFITLAEGTENALSNGGSFQETENNVDGAVFSKEDLVLGGKGSLTVQSPAGHGIVSKDALKITGGSYRIDCAGHGIAGKDNVSIADGTLTVDAGKDGIHSENNDDTSIGFVYIADGVFDLTAAGDGISASAAMQLDGGLYTIVTGGGSENAQKQTSDRWGNMGGGWPGMGGNWGGGGMGGGRPGGRSADNTASVTTTTEDSTSIKGIKAAANLVINGGVYDIDAADDGVHSNGDITVTGGEFTIATGDDGFHADENLNITGGLAVISESYEGLEALHVTVSGGDVTLTASDDGINAAGGNDQSGFGGVRGDRFGGPGGWGGGGMGGGFGSGNGSILISGGKLHITASGDGLDANGSFEITGGNTVICGPTQGDTATLDYDVSGVIRGGTFIGTGAAGGMAHSFSSAEQGVVAVRASAAAGTELILADGEGNVLLRETPQLNYALVILSCPELKKGESYRLTIGTQTETVTAS